MQREPLRAVGKYILFGFVEPAFEISVRDGVMMNGYKYVSIHPIGAAHPPEEPARSIFTRYHQQCRAETRFHKRLFDALCQLQIEYIFPHATRADRSRVALRVPGV